MNIIFFQNHFNSMNMENDIMKLVYVMKDLLVENISKEYHVLYHFTDSPFFKKIDPNSATKGSDNLFFNPLGSGLYCTSKEEFGRSFGKNKYYYLLPKKSRIKKITKNNWDSIYQMVTKKVLKSLKINYDSLNLGQKVQINRFASHPPIDSLYQFESYIEGEFDLDSVQRTISSTVDTINSKYDAVWYTVTDDYRSDSDEIVIPYNSFNPNLFFEKLPNLNS